MPILSMSKRGNLFAAIDPFLSSGARGPSAHKYGNAGPHGGRKTGILALAHPMNFYSAFLWHGKWSFSLFRPRPILESIMVGAPWSSARANCTENWISEQLRISSKSFPPTWPRLHFSACIFFFVFDFFLFVFFV